MNAQTPQKVDVQTQPTATTATAKQAPVRRVVQPNVDIIESDQGFDLYLEMPGVAKEDVSIKLEQGRLYVKGAIKVGGQDTGKMVYQEYRDADFERSFQLANDIDPQNVGAKMQDGVLQIHLARLPELQPKEILVN